MRKVSVAVAIGFLLCACGGGEAEPPKTPAQPVATTPAPAVTATAEAPKEEPKAQATPAELQQKTMKGMVDAMNAHDAKKLAGFYSDSAVIKAAGAPDVTGRDAIAANYQKLFDAFSNYKMAPSRVFTSKNDVAVVEWAFNATHTGDLWGIKATEKPVGAMGVDVLWFDKDGLVKEHHVYYDGATILSQIGLSKQKARAIPTLPSTPQTIAATGSADEQKNVDAMKSLTAALDGKKEADFVALVGDNVEYDDMTMPQTMKGKADAKKFFNEVTKGFPDAKHQMMNAWAFGDYVVSEGQMTGTNKGPYFGMPATKKTVTTHSVDIMQMKDGKMVRGWSYMNGADTMQQLGLMPTHGAAQAKAAAGDKKTDAKAGDTKAAATGEKKTDAKPADKKPAEKTEKTDKK